MTIHDDAEEQNPLLDSGTFSTPTLVPPHRIRTSFWKKALPIWLILPVSTPNPSYHLSSSRIAPVIFVSSLCVSYEL